MTANSAENAEIFLQDLKQRLDEVWEQFGKDPPLEKMIYAKGHYGVMQREELKDILYALAALKTQADSLLAECLAIPSDQRVSYSASQRLPADEEKRSIY